MENTKQDRILEIFFRGLRGEDLSVQRLADEYEVSTKSITRNINDLKNFLADHRELVGHTELQYSHQDRCYRLFMHVAFFCKGDSVAYFDIKQMICHMLGVANEMLTTKSDKAVLFLYLLYNPEELPLPPESKQEIMRIYTNTCKAACNYRFEEIFGHIVDFLIREKHISEEPEKVDKIKSSFRFVLCNQNGVIKLICTIQHINGLTGDHRSNGFF